MFMNTNCKMSITINKPLTVYSYQNVHGQDLVDYSPKIKTTLFIMGLTIPEIKTPVPSNA